MSDLVHTVSLPSPEGGFTVFHPGDDVPRWALERMGAHCFADGIHPLGESGSGDDGGPPPKAGPGSSVDAWRAYAEAHGIEMPDDAKRDDIVQALADNGVPVDRQ